MTSCGVKRQLCGANYWQGGFGCLDYRVHEYSTHRNKAGTGSIPYLVTVLAHAYAMPLPHLSPELPVQNRLEHNHNSCRTKPGPIGSDPPTRLSTFNKYGDTGGGGGGGGQAAAPKQPPKIDLGCCFSVDADQRPGLQLYKTGVCNFTCGDFNFTSLVVSNCKGPEFVTLKVWCLSLYKSTVCILQAVDDKYLYIFNILSK